MTVTNEARISRFDGDGVTRLFEVTFPFFEVAVYVGGVLKTNGEHYVVIQTTPGSVGTIDFNESLGVDPPPAGTSNVVVVGSTEAKQTTDYTDNNGFPAETLEQNFDRLTMAVIELSERLARTLRVNRLSEETPEIDTASVEGELVVIGPNGQFITQTATEVLGGINLDEALETVAQAAVSAAAAASSASQAASSASAAAASASEAEAATDVLSLDAHFTGLPQFEGKIRVGKNGGGDSWIELYDDSNDVWRKLRWNDTIHDWEVYDATGTARLLHHAGNVASQPEAEGGTENTKGMTALRVAQAISALAGDNAFPSGTTLFFVNDTAPLGWTLDTTHNDKAIRIVNGAVSVGGSLGFSSAFASRTPAGTVGGTVLDTSKIPAHWHIYLHRALNPTADGPDGGAQVTDSWKDLDNRNSSSTGGGLSHDHPFTGSAMNFNVAYVDTRMATKD
jgi:hypothetical protein